VFDYLLDQLSQSIAGPYAVTSFVINPHELDVTMVNNLEDSRMSWVRRSWSLIVSPSTADLLVDRDGLVSVLSATDSVKG
jgi:hypothetical protein